MSPSKGWGLSISAGGYTHIPPQARYPFSFHPRPYHFSWEKGRKLDAYQLIFVSKGRGHFESQPTGLRSVGPGAVFILFPGVWHRYKPEPATGWDEHWFEIQGPLLDQWRGNFPNFTPEQAIVPAPDSFDLREQFGIFHRVLLQKSEGYRTYLAGLGAAVFALALGNPTETGPLSDVETAIRKAQQQLSSNPGANFKLKNFLRDFSLSEAYFRKKFKLSTGLTVKEYQHSIRLVHAQNLLLYSHYTIKEIAASLGFNSPFHFSSFFSRRKALSPARFRRKFILSL
jgi:AraC-like DNA-binding protein